MTTAMRNPFYFLLILFTFQCLPLTGTQQVLLAEENAITQEKKSPSFTVKGSNITPVKQESLEKQPGQTTTGDQPSLFIDSPSHNIGEVWEGEDIVHPFIVKNTGTAQLDIKNVKAG